jgi:hypothetical protein
LEQDNNGFAYHRKSKFLPALTAVLILRGVAGTFPAQALLSGQGFKRKAYLRALAGKMECRFRVKGW